MEKKINFKQFIKHRQNFLRENKEESFVLEKKKSNVILSAPHGVSQVRLGASKVAEPGSLALMLEVQKRTGAHFIAKTKNCNDDAGFDEISPYKEKMKRFIKENEVKFLFDFHGLNKKRGIDVNLGTHLGQSIKNDEELFNFLHKRLEEAGFFVTIDNPFWGKLSAEIAEQTGIWSIQLEVSYDITNEYKNKDRLQKLVDILVETVERAQKSN